MEETTELFYDTKTLATILNIKESKLRNLVFKRSIPFIKINRLVRFSKKDIEKWLEGKKEAPMK